MPVNSLGLNSPIFPRTLADSLGSGSTRAAIVASTPAELRAALDDLITSTKAGKQRLIPDDNVWFATPTSPPRIGFLFTGQGAPINQDADGWTSRFACAAALREVPQQPIMTDDSATDVVQPAIVRASLMGLRVLEQFQLEAQIAVGHSLGELTGLHWAGALDEDSLLQLVTARGRAMAACRCGGAMASIGASRSEVDHLLIGTSLVVAAVNGKQRTVVSGNRTELARVVEVARSQKLEVAWLRVSHAFHSPLVAEAARGLSTALDGLHFRAPQRQLVSTITGKRLTTDQPIPQLVVDQVTSPVLFADAFEAADATTDLWLEVGPGYVLQGLAQSATQHPVVSLDAGGNRLRPLLTALGLAFVMGSPWKTQALFAGRFRRPFRMDWQPSFFTNPCEAFAAEPVPANNDHHTHPSPEVLETVPANEEDTARSPLEVVQRLAAEQAELPLDQVEGHHRLLGDLHLSSIAVGQLFGEAARQLGLAPPESPTDAATATVAELADTLTSLKSLPALESDDGTPPPGVATWTRAFRISWGEAARGKVTRPTPVPGTWSICSAGADSLAAEVKRALEHQVGGQGVLVCLPEIVARADVESLIKGAQSCLDSEEPKLLVVWTTGSVGGSVAKSLVLEAPGAHARVVRTPPKDQRAVEWVVDEVQSATGDYFEVAYDRSGTRRRPWITAVDAPSADPNLPLDSDDVILITGGGKGIGAECGFSLARETGARLALLGRSAAEAPEVKANLERMEAAGVRCVYRRCDIADSRATAEAVEEVQTNWGPVTAVLHAAGVNQPRRLSELTMDEVDRTLAPKVSGLKNVLQAIDAEHLRLLVTFGSIIGRAGLAGQADYALANEWQTQLTEDWHRQYPGCRCIALSGRCGLASAWASVWARWSHCGVKASRRSPSTTGFSSSGS